MHPRRFLYRLLPKCCQDLKRKLKNKNISELARKGFADRQVELGKGNRIPESGGICSWNPEYNSRNPECETVFDSIIWCETSLFHR